jgi:large subunit ribosomal protein L10
MVGAKKVAQWKVDEVESLKEMLRVARTTAIAIFHNLPSTAFHEIRREATKKGMNIKVSRNTLLRRALSDLGIEVLSDYMSGESAVITFDGDPFELYSFFAEKSYKLPAKAGQIAPSEIWVKKGETSLRPGPVLAELQKVGIPAAIDKGKIVIREDKLLVKANEQISADVAIALQRLEISPFEASLSPNAVFESGVLFRKEDLRIDLNEMIAQILSARNSSMELALAAGLIMDETIDSFLVRAQRNAVALAMKSGFVADETIELLVREAEAAAMTVNALISGEQKIHTDSAEERKEEKKEEETSEEDIASGLGALFG